MFTLPLETQVLFQGVEQQDGKETGAKEVSSTESMNNKLKEGWLIVCVQQKVACLKQTHVH